MNMPTPMAPSFHWLPIKDGAAVMNRKQANNFIRRWIGPGGSTLQIVGDFYSDNDAVVIVHDPNDPSLIDPEDQAPWLFLHVHYS
tara:strand:- start:753 stop:1007 length:255 start_codon:yes stop_codon:yes gene_type:complete